MKFSLWSTSIHISLTIDRKNRRKGSVHCACIRCAHWNQREMRNYWNRTIINHYVWNFERGRWDAMAFSLEEIDHATEYALGQLGTLASRKSRKRRWLLSWGAATHSHRSRRGTSRCYCLLPLVIVLWEEPSVAQLSFVICNSPLTVQMLDQRRKYAPRALVTEFVGG